jgi:hypothetical protein
LQRLCLLIAVKKFSILVLGKKIKRYSPSIDDMWIKVFGTWSMMF